MKCFVFVLADGIAKGIAENYGLDCSGVRGGRAMWISGCHDF